jgi:hypothetical protein
MIVYEFTDFLPKHGNGLFAEEKLINFTGSELIFRKNPVVLHPVWS